MASSRSVYIFRRLLGLILYGLAYAALWPGLTRSVVTIQGNATFWSNSKFGASQGGEFMKSTSRSTIELVLELFNSGYYFPSGVIVFFSVVSPCVKLLVILYGEIVGNLFRVKFEDTSKIVDLRKGLRVIAKYQCVDVFLTIITRQLLNSDFVSCKVESGFYFFTFYSFMSILASQVSDTVPSETSLPVHKLSSITSSAGSARMSKLEAFLLFSSISMFVVGLSWAIGFPILAVKFLFQSKIVIGESIASLSSFLNLHAATFEDVFATSVVGVTCIVVPVVVVSLSCIVQCCDAERSSRIFYSIAKFTSFLADWSLIDVFAVALLTSLFSFASFSVIRTVAPWGFYCVLMAAMSAYEVVKAVQVSLVGGGSGGYSRLSQDGLGEVEMAPVPIETSPHRRKRSGSAGASPKQTATTETKRTTVVLNSGFLHVIITIVKRLGLPFFMLKALGWAIFFIIWWMNSGAGSLDINSLSSTLRSNTPLVESALQTSLPAAIGMCDHYHNAVGNTTDSDKAACVLKPYLHYEKHTAYEVLARWLSGFDKVKLTDMYIAVPTEGKLSLNVRGAFESVKLSLFIGQCLGQWFSSDDERQIPVCSSVFDDVHEWTNITWSLEVEADCSVAAPYVRNIVVDEIVLDSQMKIEQDLGWGFSVPLEDLGEKFKAGIRDSIQPLLAKKEEWIPWGPKQYDLTSLLSMLVELNADSLGGTLQFTCPKPT